MLDSGVLLNECAAALQKVADMAPGELAPENGTDGRYLLQAVLNYTASEVRAFVPHVDCTPCAVHILRPMGTVPYAPACRGALSLSSPPGQGFIVSRLRLARGRVAGPGLTTCLAPMLQLHQSYAPLYDPAATPEQKAAAIAKLNTKLKYVNENMVNGKKFLVGDSFTIADSYLYIVLSWCARPRLRCAPRVCAGTRARVPWT